MHQSLHERLRCPLLASLDRDVERVRTGVRQAVDDAADIFDLDGLEAAEGPGEFVAGDLVGHAHRQLVDGPAAVTLEDVDPDHVGSRLTERCRRYPDRARPVGEPYADHVPSHTENLEKLCERQVAVALTLAEIATDQVPGLVRSRRPPRSRPASPRPSRNPPRRTSSPKPRSRPAAPGIGGGSGLRFRDSPPSAGAFLEQQGELRGNDLPVAAVRPRRTSCRR